MALGNMRRQSRKRHPEKPALLFGEQRWTYAQLDEITDRIGAAFRRLGVRPGDRVALLFANRPEIVFCCYACFKLGAVAVPLNTRLKGPEIEFILDHCGARLFIGEEDLFPEVHERRHPPAASPPLGVRRVPGPALPAVERYYIVGNASRFPDTRPFEELLERPAEGPFPEVADGIPAVILYTSGTTARPKGVTHSHRGLERTAASMRAMCDLGPEDVFAAVAPICHSAGFAAMMIPALSTGATLLLIPRFEPPLVLRSMAEHRATLFFGLPVMYSALVNDPAAARCDLSSLRCPLAGGDAIPTELHRRFQERFGVRLLEGCGMTEIAPYAVNPLHGVNKVGSIGRPAVGVSLRLVDDQGRDLPPGEVGEILVKSDATMIGYWDEPEATAAALQDGWLRTGDLARVDEDGYYWFVGRKKEIIVRGGSNISPVEIEEAICQHPLVKEAGVVGVTHPTWGEIVWAYVAPNGGRPATEEDLRRFLADRIAAYKVPEAIVFLPELPKGPTGKIHRRTLRDWATAAASR